MVVMVLMVVPYEFLTNSTLETVGVMGMVPKAVDILMLVVSELIC